MPSCGPSIDFAPMPSVNPQDSVWACVTFSGIWGVLSFPKQLLDNSWSSCVFFWCYRSFISCEQPCPKLYSKSEQSRYSWPGSGPLVTEHTTESHFWSLWTQKSSATILNQFLKDLWSPCGSGTSPKADLSCHLLMLRSCLNKTIFIFLPALMPPT